MKLIVLVLISILAKIYCNCNLDTKFDMMQYGKDTNNDSLSENNVTLKTFTRTEHANLRMTKGNLNELCKDFLMHINDKKSIEFDGFGLTRLQKNAFDDGFDQLETLSISNNYIYEIQEEVFKLAKLETLVLAKNGITVIADGAFKYLTSLKTLLLPYNNIHYMSPDWFKYSPILRTIILIYNQISTVDDEVFSGLTYANTCDIYDVNLSKACPLIVLSQNRIESISKDAFKGLKNISIFSADYNELTELPLISDVNILLLNFQYNEISDVSQTVLELYEGRVNYTFLFGNSLTEQSINNMDMFNKENHGHIYYNTHYAALVQKIGIKFAA